MPTDSNAFDHQTYLKNAPELPGIYKMLDSNADVLYVGKAKDLKKRLSCYFRKQGLAVKTQAMVARIQAIETVVTNTESEALILEQNLIKTLKPPYNILLRDDKSYPFIYLSHKDRFPRLALHRGRKNQTGRFYGPYPSAGAARETLGILQKIFKVRQCEDSFFRNRTRPCLQYQINRCKAPCVDLVDEQEYARDVQDSVRFLEGKSQEIIFDLIGKMDAAAESLAFEQAATFRDQVNFLRQTQEGQAISAQRGDADVLGIAWEPGGCCVIVIFVRQGRVLGTRQFHPDFKLETTRETALLSFLANFYIRNADARDFPAEIVIPFAVEDQEVLETTLREVSGKAISLRHQVRSDRKRWLELADKNAVQALAVWLADKKNIYQRFLMLQQALKMSTMPERIECFDISHTMGEGTVASCVVFDQQGAVKSDYRRFNIRDITPGDDYAAIGQAVERRYARLLTGEGKMPDLILIDGGAGQLGKAMESLESLQLTSITVVGVGKGETRKPGMETLLDGVTGKEYVLEPSSPALHLVQQVRDEAHRFAITGHRQRREGKRRKSTLEDIPGVGAKRRSALLKYFGGLQSIQQATVAELSKVNGISKALAQEIHDHLHS
ncbi:excinuclease ABC subunit UvrC [Kistimonas asteriae]|uniref:excinuclease ABC subunit UvrC n=1 Tax=Kistimonas asteriae TaxID=517724 RepID=UPI001BAE37B9|nr:excinuclease ABC subunit UvrC [Kistimonas asteriae]